MRKHVQKIIIALLVAALLLGGTVALARTTQSINVTYRDIRLVVDGELVTPRDAQGRVVEPFLFGGTTFLPVRAVSEALGYDVTWVGSTSTVYIGGASAAQATESEDAIVLSSRTQTITVTYRDIRLVVNGEEVTPRDAQGHVVEPFIFGGTTFLPVRAVSEALGYEVAWSGSTSTVYIGERPEPPAPTTVDIRDLIGMTYNEVVAEFGHLLGTFDQNDRMGSSGVLFYEVGLVLYFDVWVPHPSLPDQGDPNWMTTGRVFDATIFADIWRHDATSPSSAAMPNVVHLNGIFITTAAEAAYQILGGWEATYATTRAEILPGQADDGSPTGSLVVIVYRLQEGA